MNRQCNLGLEGIQCHVTVYLDYWRKLRGNNSSDKYEAVVMSFHYGVSFESQNWFQAFQCLLWIRQCVPNEKTFTTDRLTTEPRYQNKYCFNVVLKHKIL